MLSSPSRRTGCTCEGPGWCTRHHIRKTEAWFNLCRLEPSYFQAWEEGRGPAQLTPSGIPRLASPRGPGSLLRRMLGCCGHYTFVRRMNTLGANGCEEHVDELVGLVLIEKEKFAMRLDAKTVLRMIRLAIEESRRLEAERDSEMGVRSDDGTGAAQ